MRKMLLAFISVVFAVSSGAQSVLDDIHRNVLYTASNYMAYPSPSARSLTPAPKGMTPFYISHYGRHGSRWHSKPSMYDQPYQTLAKADSLGKLTPLGREVMLKLDTIRHDAENRWGELTPLGAQQQRQIAQRMVERFPEVFTGNTPVSARSTSVGRCILSMENFLLQLQRHNPHLAIYHNATRRDQDYLNLQDKKLMALRKNEASQQLYDKSIRAYERNERLMRSLFNDTAYVSQHVNATDLDFQLVLVAAIMQNVELGKRISLFDIYTEDELYRLWKIGNARWYIGWGGCSVNGGVQPYMQRSLLRRMIDETDGCIRRSETRVDLRFGHETVLLPLVCLLDVDGYGLATDNIDELEPRGWVNYRIFPMSGNLQLVFYRHDKNDKDVLFKVLLNENEATLPLTPVEGPYYRWSDFRKYYLQKLDAYEE